MPPPYIRLSAGWSQLSYTAVRMPVISKGRAMSIEPGADLAILCSVQAALCTLEVEHASDRGQYCRLHCLSV